MLKNMARHLLFQDRQKVFECVHRMTWWISRYKMVIQTYTDGIRDIYLNSDSVVRIALGDITSFHVTVKVFQGIVFSLSGCSKGG